MLFENKIGIHESARALIEAAAELADNSYRQFLSRYHFIKNIRKKEWLYFITIAGAFMGAETSFKLNLRSFQEEQLKNIILHELEQWERDGIQTYHFCKKFYQSRYQSMRKLSNDGFYIQADVVGLWLALNLIPDFSYEEKELNISRLMGSMIVEYFNDWWLYINDLSTSPTFCLEKGA